MVPVLVYGQGVSDTNFSGVVGPGARAFGMGGAFIAVADDAAAASWYPGAWDNWNDRKFRSYFGASITGKMFPRVTDWISVPVFSGLPDPRPGKAVHMGLILFLLPIPYGSAISRSSPRSVINGPSIIIWKPGQTMCCSMGLWGRRWSNRRIVSRVIQRIRRGLAVVYESGNYLRYNEDFGVTRYTDLKFYLSTIYSF